jgi:hypothetical protein
VTAKSPASIIVPAVAQRRWRIAWAERENERRRRAYDAESEAWHRHNDQLIRLRIEAAGFLGCTQPRTGLPVDLDDDEVVYRVLPAAELVEAEARHVSGLPTPGLTVAAASLDAPGHALPRGVRVVDAGMAVVTNHRVAFAGRESRREWAYADMVPAHHPDVPLTLLHTTDGSRLAGLLVPAAAAVNFRFYLTLALAAATGERAAVAAQIDSLLDAHQGTRPAPPPPAEPDHAPLTALRPDTRAATAAAVVALTLATLSAGTFGPEQAGLPYRADAGTRDVATTTEAPDANGATAPSSPGEPVTSDSGTAASLTGPAAAPARAGAPVAEGPIPRQRTTSGPTSTASAVATTGPAALPAPTTGPPPTTGLAPTTPPGPTTGPPPTTTPPPTTGPAPTIGPPSPEPPMVNLCLDPLQLPLVQRLLCGSTAA